MRACVSVCLFVVFGIYCCCFVVVVVVVAVVVVVVVVAVVVVEDYCFLIIIIVVVPQPWRLFGLTFCADRMAIFLKTSEKVPIVLVKRRERTGGLLLL